MSDGSSALRPFRPALLALSDALLGIEWQLGGSALLAALGLTDEVGDLDVTVPPHALAAVQTGLDAWIAEVSVGDAPPPWCSDWLVRAIVEGVEVDVIGGLCVLTHAGRGTVPQELGGHLDVDGVAIPLADPGVWWWVYRSYKPEKANLLAAVVPPERRSALQRSLGDPRRE